MEVRRGVHTHTHARSDGGDGGPVKTPRTGADSHPTNIPSYPSYVHVPGRSAVQRTALHIGDTIRVHTHTHTHNIARTVARTDTHTHARARARTQETERAKETPLRVQRQIFVSTVTGRVNGSQTGRTRRRSQTPCVRAVRRRILVSPGVYYRVKIAKRYGTAEQ